MNRKLTDPQWRLGVESGSLSLKYLFQDACSLPVTRKYHFGNDFGRMIDIRFVKSKPRTINETIVNQSSSGKFTDYGIFGVS